MKILILSSSLNPKSRSRVLALAAKSQLSEKASVEVDFVDLQVLELPLCDGGAAYGDPAAVELSQRMEAADAYVLASPVYNYDTNAAMKNAIELAGRKMEDKLVGCLFAAGGTMSYMSGMGFINSLMLDFRTIVLPRFVYAAPSDWEEDEMGEAIAGRLKQFVEDFYALGTKLA